MSNNLRSLCILSWVHCVPMYVIRCVDDMMLDESFTQESGLMPWLQEFLRHDRLTLPQE
jgi:hypothetical protein